MVEQALSVLFKRLETSVLCFFQLLLYFILGIRIEVLLNNYNLTAMLTDDAVEDGARLAKNSLYLRMLKSAFNIYNINFSPYLSFFYQTTPPLSGVQMLDLPTMLRRHGRRDGSHWPPARGGVACPSRPGVPHAPAARQAGRCACAVATDSRGEGLAHTSC